MPARRNDQRAYVELLMRRGELASASEAAWLAAVPRQTAARWAREAGIDIDAARMRWLARQRRRLLMIIEGKSPRRPTKAEMRERLNEDLKRYAAKLEKQRQADSGR